MVLVFQVSAFHQETAQSVWDNAKAKGTYGAFIKELESGAVGLGAANLGEQASKIYAIMDTCNARFSGEGKSFNLAKLKEDVEKQFFSKQVPASNNEFLVVTGENLESQRQSIIEEFKRFVVFPSLDSPEKIISLRTSLRDKLDKFSTDLGKDFSANPKAKNSWISGLKNGLAEAAVSEASKKLYDYLLDDVFPTEKGSLSINTTHLTTNCERLVTAIGTLHNFDLQFKTDFLNRSVSGDVLQRRFESYSDKFSTPEMDIVLGRVYGFSGEGLAGTGLCEASTENIGTQYFNLMKVLAVSKKREDVLQEYAALSSRYPKAIGTVVSDITRLQSQLLPNDVSRPSVDLVGTIKFMDLLSGSEQFREMSDDQAATFVALLETLQPKTQCFPLSNQGALDGVVLASKNPWPDFNYVFGKLRETFNYQNNIFLAYEIGESARKSKELYSEFYSYLGQLDAQLLDYLHTKYVPLDGETVRISGLVPNPFQQVGIYGANLFFDRAALRLHPTYTFGNIQEVTLPISPSLQTPNIRESLYRNQDEAVRFRNTRSYQSLQYPYASKPTITFYSSKQTVDQALQSAYNKVMWTEGTQAIRRGSFNAAYTGDVAHPFNPAGYGMAGDLSLQQQKGEIYGGARHLGSRYGDVETKTVEELSNSRNFAVPLLGSYMDMYASHRFNQTENTASKTKQSTETLDLNAANRWKNGNVLVVGHVNNTMQDSGSQLTFSKGDFLNRVSLSLGLTGKDQDDLASRVGFSAGATDTSTATMTQGDLVSLLRNIMTPDGKVRRFDDAAIDNFVSGLRTDPNTTVKSGSTGNMFSDFEIYGKVDPLGTWVRANLTKEQKNEILRQMGAQSADSNFADVMTHQYYLIHTNFGASGHTLNLAGESYMQNLALSAKNSGTKDEKLERIAFAFGYQVPQSWIELAFVGAKTLDNSVLAGGAGKISNNMYLGGAWFKVDADELFSYATGSSQGYGQFRLGNKDYARQRKYFKGGAIDYLIKEKLNISAFYSESDMQLKAEGTTNPQFFGGSASLKDIGFQNGLQFGFARRTDTGEGVLNSLVTITPAENYDISGRASGLRRPDGSSEAGATVGLMNKKSGWAIIGSGARANYLDQPYLDTRTLSGIRKNVSSLSSADLSSRENIGRALGNVYSGFGAYQDWTLADDVTRNAYGSFGLQLWKWPSKNFAATLLSSRLKADSKSDIFYAGMINFTDQFAIAGGVLVPNDEIKRTDETITKLVGVHFSSPDFAVKVQGVELQNKQNLAEGSLSGRLNKTDVAVRGLVGSFTHRLDIYVGSDEFHGVLDMSRLDQTRSYGVEVGAPLWATVDLAIQGIILNQIINNGQLARSYRLGGQIGFKELLGKNTYLGVEMALEHFNLAGQSGTNPFFKATVRWAP